MLKTLTIAAAALLVAGILAAAPKQNYTAESQQVRHGRYLVNDVVGCGDCHTPRLPTGELDKKHWLEGTPLFMAPVHPIPNWASVAPPIAGLPAWKPEQIVRLLETGALPDGTRPKPPMPTFHMTPSDAQAVVAYLESLGARK